MVPFIKIKRAYDKPLKKAGYRILVDRLWPRGIGKDDVLLDEWAKQLAPSVHLRKWWGHTPELWDEFQKRYMAELRHNKATEDFVESHADKKVLTLIYGAKDTEHNHALVLQEYLEQKFRS
jgi:uncharacterized protein YeaO (DUF488 family)